MMAHELIEQLMSLDEIEASLNGLVDDDKLTDMAALRFIGQSGCLPGIKPPANQDLLGLENVEENLQALQEWLAHKAWEIKRDDN